MAVGRLTDRQTQVHNTVTNNNRYTHHIYEKISSTTSQLINYKMVILRNLLRAAK